jgi:glycerol-3-phosphate O-acyltransferase/dihydroxyacetone phosphate acyltransferase
MLFLPSAKGQTGSSVDIAKILGPNEIRIKRPLRGKLAMTQLTGRDDIDDQGNLGLMDINGPKDGYEGTTYKLAPRIDQSEVYRAVFDRLKSGGCVGIFPEGGSHDRTELLPLKAGVAIMALGTLTEAPDCGLKIVPVGMNYFHAHKFRSRAVIEFGQPLEVPKRLVEMYKNNERREAVGQVLDMVHQALSAVTVSTPDYDTLMVIQAARRLYNPTGKKLPLPVIVELNRRLALGYERYKNDERIVQLKKSVNDYNRQLRYLNIRDHQVQYGKMSWPKVVFTLFYRLAKLLALSAGVLPGLILFSPVFIATKIISKKKAKAALAGSSVKIQGKDVMATWKIMVAMFFAPVLYFFYTAITALLVWQDRLGGRVPEWVPIWAVFVAGFIFFPTITFAALRFGEVGMDILKSLRPLALCIFPTSSYSLNQLRERRAELSEQVTRVINTLGPEMFPDFEHTRLVGDSGRAAAAASAVETAAAAAASRAPTRPSMPYHVSSGTSSPGAEGAESPPQAPLTRRSTTRSSRAIPRNESFSNIGKIQLFATRPPSRSRSRSSSAGGGPVMGGFPVTGFTSLDSKEGFDEANRRIRQAMKERGEIRRRKREAKEAGLEDESSDDEEGSVDSLEESAGSLRDYEEARKEK